MAEVKAELVGNLWKITTEVGQAVEEDDTTVLELRVAQPDLGKVIGKQGRTARSIRTILGAAGMKLHKRYTLEIIE